MISRILLECRLVWGSCRNLGQFVIDGAKTPQILLDGKFWLFLNISCSNGCLTSEQYCKSPKPDTQVLHTIFVRTEVTNSEKSSFRLFILPHSLEHLSDRDDRFRGFKPLKLISSIFWTASRFVLALHRYTRLIMVSVFSAFCADVVSTVSSKLWTLPYKLGSTTALTFTCTPNKSTRHATLMRSSTILFETEAQRRFAAARGCLLLTPRKLKGRP